jgi:hypothetical protein
LKSASLFDATRDICCNRRQLLQSGKAHMDQYYRLIQRFRGKFALRRDHRVWGCEQQTGIVSTDQDLRTGGVERRHIKPL